MIIEKAPAKINLALNVVGKRNDNYHDLQMVMTTIDLYDRLSFEKINEDKVILNTNKYYLPTDEKNLVYQVAIALKDKYQIKTGLKIYLKKHIPVAAGLAGGSSDAAATIRALNKLFRLNMSLNDMIEFGVKFGADIPFCIYNKTAVVSGKGEKIQPINKAPRCWVVLVKPLFGVSTKEVFENINMNEITHPNVDQVIKSIKEQDYTGLCMNLGNSLEDVTFKLYPEVKNIKEKLLGLGADAVLMSGSGPTVFALTLKENRARMIRDSLDKSKYELYYVRMLG